MHEEFVHNLETLLNSNFHYSLETSELHFVLNSDWEKLKTNKNTMDTLGIFAPRNMTALVRDIESPYQTIIHEHIGHRTFYEMTSYGLKTRELEAKLRHNDSNEILLSELRKHNEFINHKSEGFANWLTRYFCDQLNIDFMHHFQTQKERDYFFDLYQIQKEFGPYSTFYLSNPNTKVHNNKIIVELLKEVYGDSFFLIDSIIYYGSKRDFSDIDLLIVVNENEDVSKLNDYRHSNLFDIGIIEKTDLIQKLKLQDITYTQAVFSGESICGDDSFKSKIVKYCKNHCNFDEYHKNLQSQFKYALESTLTGLDIIKSQLTSVAPLDIQIVTMAQTLVNLSFADTYNLLLKGDFYNIKKDEVFFSRLITRNPTSILANSRKQLKKIKDYFTRSELKFIGLKSQEDLLKESYLLVIESLNSY